MKQALILFQAFVVTMLQVNSSCVLTRKRYKLDFRFRGKFFNIDLHNFHLTADYIHQRTLKKCMQVLVKYAQANYNLLQEFMFTVTLLSIEFHFIISCYYSYHMHQHIYIYACKMQMHTIQCLIINSFTLLGLRNKMLAFVNEHRSHLLSCQYGKCPTSDNLQPSRFKFQC